MYLKRLELKGFKSFPTKTDIMFQEGITAIVGPNGSGKSNISDAVRWVLGEQSIKSLRGEKLEDVIFAGSDEKKPMNYCEVALTIDNSDNKLNLDFNEITIKRRAYRNGESAFFLNNKNCRLKDIKEILLDTGIGKDGYSIIEQGKVDEILSNNPANRRKVFDEACGISKFRYKKQEAERNLKNTKENLERIYDIYIEIENQLKPLFTQQEKAIKYLELSENLKKIEVNSYIREIEALERELKEVEEHSEVVKVQTIETEKQKASIEKDLEQTNKEIEDINEGISKAQDYINSINAVISQKDSQINIINERMKNHKNDIERNNKEISESNEKLQQNIELAKSLELDKLDKEEKLNKLKSELNSLNDLNINKKDQIQNINKEIEDLKDGIISILNKRQETSNKLSTLTANLENIKSRKEIIEVEIKEIKKEMDENNISLEQSKIIFDSRNNELQLLNKNINTIKQELKDLLYKNDNIDKQIQNNNYEINNFNSKLSIYIEMENHNEGFNKGVKEVLKNKNLKGIFGALGQVITVREEYEKAIESALGAYVQNIITDNEYSAKTAIDYLKSNNLGRVTFLPLNVIKSNKIDSKLIKSNTKIIGIASGLISYDLKYKNIIESVLGRTIIIDTIENGIRFAKETGHKYKVVTLDGEILNPGGSLTGGSFRTNGNILSRKRLITEYQNKVKELREISKTLQDNKKEYSERVFEVENTIASYEEKLKEVEKIVIIESSNINKIEDEIRNTQYKLSKLVNESNGLDSNLKYTLERTEDINKEIINLNNKHNDNKIKIEKLTIDVKDSSGSYESDKIKYDGLNLELVRYEQVYKNILNDINRTNKANEELNTKILEITNALNLKDEERIKLKEDVVVEEKEKISLSQQLNDSIRNLENKNAVGLNLKQNLEDLNKELKSIDRQYLDLKESLFKVQGRLDRIKSTNETYLNKIFEDYEMTLVQAIEIKDDSIQIDKKLLDSLKKEIRSLGNVNIDSIKEYEEVKERYDFYSEQKKDLEQSIEAIEKLIDELEKNMKSEFKVKFKEINENFKYVYKRLFGGGYGELTILDEQNILESDIEITAQPPGKKMKSLNLLSGGEKALTAISILFSILLAKPTPFCILDEIEAPLDDANIFRFGEFLKELSKDTQFISVTHRRGTMDAAHYIYGVTMQEKAISKVLSLKLNEAKEIIDLV